MAIIFFLLALGLLQEVTPSPGTSTHFSSEHFAGDRKILSAEGIYSYENGKERLDLTTRTYKSGHVSKASASWDQQKGYLASFPAGVAEPRGLISATIPETFLVPWVPRVAMAFLQQELADIPFDIPYISAEYPSICFRKRLTSKAGSRSVEIFYSLESWPAYVDDIKTVEDVSPTITVEGRSFGLWQKIKISEEENLVTYEFPQSIPVTKGRVVIKKQETIPTGGELFGVNCLRDCETAYDSNLGSWMALRADGSLTPLVGDNHFSIASLVRYLPGNVRQELDLGKRGSDYYEPIEMNCARQVAWLAIALEKKMVLSRSDLATLPEEGRGAWLSDVVSFLRNNGCSEAEALHVRVSGIIDSLSEGNSIILHGYAAKEREHFLIVTKTAADQIMVLNPPLSRRVWTPRELAEFCRSEFGWCVALDLRQAQRLRPLSSTSKKWDTVLIWASLSLLGVAVLWKVRRRGRKLLCGIAILFVCSGCHEEPRAVEVEVDSETQVVDLGERKSASLIPEVTSVQWKNETGGPVSIVRVRSSCACLGCIYPEGLIAPGEEIELQYKVRWSPGKVSVLSEVEFSDGTRKKIELRAVTPQKKGWRIDPPNLVVREVGEMLPLRIVRLESTRIPMEVTVLSDWAKMVGDDELPILNILVESRPKKKDLLKLRIDGENCTIPVFSRP